MLIPPNAIRFPPAVPAAPAKPACMTGAATVMTASRNFLRFRSLISFLCDNYRLDRTPRGSAKQPEPLDFLQAAALSLRYKPPHDEEGDHAHTAVYQKCAGRRNGLH